MHAKLLKVRAAIGEELLRMLIARFKMLRISNSLVPDQQVQESSVIYADPVFDTLLSLLLPKIEGLVGHDLHPTYSFARLYSANSVLKRHVDRAACEISVSIPIWSDSGTFDPIFFEIDDERKAVELEPGDIVLFRGCELPHWRDPATSEHFLIFLHYVNAAGPHSSWKYDKREHLA